MQDEYVDANSDSDECMNEGSPSSSASDMAENGAFYCYPPLLILINPDHIWYRDNKLHFTH